MLPPIIIESFTILRDGKVVQTIGVAPVVGYAFSLGADKVAWVEAHVLAFTNDFTKGGGVHVQAIFARRGQADVVRAAAPQVDVVAHNFSNPKPSIDLVADGTDIQVVLTGQPGATLRWHLDVTIRETA